MFFLYLQFFGGFFFFVFFFNFLKDTDLFRGDTNTPVMDFWSHLLWVSKSGRMHALLLECNGFLRFTYDVTTTNLLTASMVAKSF